MERIIIPRPLQIVVDDLGWFCPTDDRPAGGPSRSAMSRYHLASDYEAINYLGEQLGMRINCAFILGEWDPDNRLRSVKHLSKYGDGWDNAAHLDPDEMRRCVEVINSSPYIDFAVHGLLHGYYMAGTDNHDMSDYYYRKSKELIMIPEDEVRHRLDCFFDIVDHYGIKKEINSFVPPSFNTRIGELTRILRDYGILYSSTIFRTVDCDGERPSVVTVENGIITVDRNNNLIPWNSVSSDFSKFAPTVGIFGTHWPNFLHHDPERSHEVVDGAVKYFRACEHNFGTVLSRDMKYCATQSLYSQFATLTEREGECVIDLSAVPTAVGRGDFFTVSLKSEPKELSGAEISLVSDLGEFKNYDIYPKESVVKIKI